jgi:hypothetical protein
MFISNCKVCKVAMPELTFTTSMFPRPNGSACDACKIYSYLTNRDGYIETETLKVGNYYFIYFANYKSASVVEKNENTHRALSKIELTELTADIANEWVKKLKTYVLFQ